LGRSRVMVRLPASHQCVHTARMALQDETRSVQHSRQKR
jgi:hypothetical protein